MRRLMDWYFPLLVLMGVLSGACVGWYAGHVTANALHRSGE